MCDHVRGNRPQGPAAVPMRTGVSLTRSRESGKSAAVTTAPDIAALPSAASRRPIVGAVVVIAAMTLLRIVYASTIELRTDEAYYWTWSKESVLSFLDHPPGIAWLIRFGTGDLYSAAGSQNITAAIPA